LTPISTLLLYAVKGISLKLANRLNNKIWQVNFGLCHKCRAF
jgi:hypothetical protein